MNMEGDVLVGHGGKVSCIYAKDYILDEEENFKEGYDDIATVEFFSKK